MSDLYADDDEDDDAEEDSDEGLYASPALTAAKSPLWTRRPCWTVTQELVCSLLQRLFLTLELEGTATSSLEDNDHSAWYDAARWKHRAFCSKGGGRMPTAAKLVLPALAAAMLVWARRGAWCARCGRRWRILRLLAVSQPASSNAHGGALAGLLFVRVPQLVFLPCGAGKQPRRGQLAQAMEWQLTATPTRGITSTMAKYGYGTGGAFQEQELMIVFFRCLGAAGGSCMCWWEAAIRCWGWPQARCLPGRR